MDIEVREDRKEGRREQEIVKYRNKERKDRNKK
jgi:hypothetical protein